MELWDILDESRNKTGRTIARGQPLKEGEYHLAAQIYIINSKKEFLIQKRSMKKHLWPGQWDVTGGSVVAGEDSLTGAIREVEEELGITLPAESFSLITTLQGKNYFLDIWAAFSDVSIDEVVMQQDEVDEVKFVKAEEMIDIISNAQFRNNAYKEAMISYIRA